MSLITIPFDYEDRKDRQDIIPICVNDTDRRGQKIAWRWIEALASVADPIRNVARTILDDVWRASELADVSLEAQWHEHGEDFGRYPQLRIFAYAKWKARDWQYGHWRVRKGYEKPLGDLEATLRDHKDFVSEYDRRLLVDYLREQLLNAGHTEAADAMDLILHGCEWNTSSSSKAGSRVNER